MLKPVYDEKTQDSVTQDSVTQDVLAYILKKFDQGSIAPGGRLIASEISRELGVSRAPVREALHILVGRGIVDLNKDCSPRLRAFSPEDLVHLWEISEAVAAIGLRKCAEKINDDPSYRPAIVKAFKTFVIRGDGDLLKLYERLGEFHRVADAIAGNPFVEQAIGLSTFGYVRRAMVQYMRDPGAIDRYLENYRRIKDAILAGDGPSTEAAWRFHCRWSMSTILERSKSH
jgi:DNA-binding GntR family transcriptional regulator